MLPQVVRFLNAYEEANFLTRPSSISIGSFVEIIDPRSSRSASHEVGDFVEAQYLEFQRHKEHFFREVLKVYVTNYIELNDELFASKGGLGQKKAAFLKKRSRNTLTTVKSLLKAYNEEIAFLICKRQENTNSWYLK